MKIEVGRRSLLKGGAALASGTALAGPLTMFSQKAQAAVPGEELGKSPYGRLAPVKDLSTGLYLLQLPRGFSYKSYAWGGDPMSNGQPNFTLHDGMGVISYKRVGRGYEMVICRNHETRNGSTNPFGEQLPLGTIGAAGVYDNRGDVAGGNTNLVFRNGNWVDNIPSLGGTIRNCAGGTTPWGSWMSCEETLTNLEEEGGLKHGYVFEVPADANATSGVPIVDMGRFSHEAVAVDPKTGYVYETEDARNRAGFYRYIPNDDSGQIGSLEQGGVLYMAKVVGEDNVNWLTPEFGDSYAIEWVRVKDPDMDPGEFDDPDGLVDSASGPFLQGWAGGAARMSRGEGIWWSDVEDVAYVVDTSAGLGSDGRIGRGEGAVWCYNPRTETMTCVFASKAQIAANNPDNITVSPRGGILLCEDGGGFDNGQGRAERLLGLMPDGVTFEFARNNCILEPGDIEAAGKNPDFWQPGDYRRTEWAGACFDPTGRILFVNMQGIGITYAITGPWRKGPF